MSKIKLTAKEKNDLEVRHKHSRDVKECYRINAVLLRSEDWTIPMISQALRIHESTVIRHINDYTNDKLTIDSGGSSSMLNASQTEELINYLEQNTHQSTHEIITHVQNTYNVTYSIPGINKWLHRNEFRYKKPKGYPYKADKQQQEEFIEKYKELKATIPEEDSLMFMDSCHPSMATKITHGWIRKGENKGIETTASRTRINLIGALGLDNIAKTIVGDYKTINGEAIVNFMKLIRKKSKVTGTIHLILDRAGYHRSEEVVNASAKLDIKLHYLPP